MEWELFDFALKIFLSKKNKKNKAINATFISASEIQI